MGGFWCYGLIYDKGKAEIAEIYFNEKNKVMGCCGIELRQLKNKKDRKLILSDIRGAITRGIIFRVKKNRLIKQKVGNL